MAVYSGDSYDFTDEEIMSELSRLGYDQFDREQLQGFKRDLQTLVQAERSKSFGSNESYSYHHERSPLQAYPSREKENFNSRWRSSSNTLKRAPLSSNTNYLSSDRSYADKYKPVYQYNDEVRARVGDLYGSPGGQQNTSPLRMDPYDSQYSADISRRYGDVYEPVSQSRSGLAMDSLYRASPARPQSADGEQHIKHLDDYWHFPGRNASSLPVGRNGSTGFSPKKTDHHLSMLYSSGQDYTEASNVTTEDDTADASRMSQGSIIKRKVARKLEDGTSEVYEESYLNEDADSDVSEENLADRFKHSVNVRPASEHRLFSRISSAKAARSEIDPSKKSVIWPEMKPSNKLGIVKSDPVKNINSYKQLWNKDKVPEEKKHKNLRWAVREQMLYKDICYEKPKRKFVENKYIVPTDKKRQDLRWRIRSEMAAGHMPSGSNY